MIIDIYSDGAVAAYDGGIIGLGDGGYAAKLVYGTHEKIVSGHEVNTTNNRMELTGVIMALSALKRPCEVVIHTDSMYVCNALTKRWLDGWKKNSWINSRHKPVENKDLWELLDSFRSVHKIKVDWIRKNRTEPENMLMRQLALEECQKAAAQKTVQVS